MDLEDLKKKIHRARKEDRPIMMVVSVAGTTELGELDPCHEVQDYLDELKESQGIHIWHHVDAAYGGFFCSLLRGTHDEKCLTEYSRNSLRGIRRANSVTLDPHKLGYVPFAAGAFICCLADEYETPPFDAPYVRFSDKSDCGLHTIEGSRSAGGAVATWLTAKSIGLDAYGYGRILRRTIEARKMLSQLLMDSIRDVRLAPFLDTNICCFCVGQEGESLKSINERSVKIYQAFSPEAKADFYVSKTHLRWDSYRAYLEAFLEGWKPRKDADELILVRLVLMNPFFETKETKANFPKAFVEALQANL